MSMLHGVKVPEDCWACGGDRLPLTCYYKESYDPPPREDRWLCEVCANSYAVADGGPLSRGEKDVLIGNHILLAEIRALREKAWDWR